MSAAIQARGLRKTYSDGGKILEVLKGIDLEVRKGEIIAVVGPSGAGKSTLLHILGLMDSATSGDLQVLDRDVKTLTEKERDQTRNAGVGFLFQFHYLLPELTLLENIALPLRIAGEKTEKSFQRARTLLENVGLKDRTSHFPSQVSGGEQQRAALARAMAGNPKILICDEPTGNLDLERGEEIRALIWRMAKEQQAAVLVATHNPDIAKKADRTLKMMDGKIVPNS